ALSKPRFPPVYQLGEISKGVGRVCWAERPLVLLIPATAWSLLDYQLQRTLCYRISHGLACWPASSVSRENARRYAPDHGCCVSGSGVPSGAPVNFTRTNQQDFEHSTADKGKRWVCSVQ
ncbi:unnamed protein product, partial [Ectocarpus sp. 12 AP-2014]